MSDCIHETTAERRKAKRGGTEVIALQCLICGVAIREVAKDGRNLDTLDWFDPTIADEFEFRRKAEFERLHKRRTDEYLTRTGPWWRRTRNISGQITGAWCAQLFWSEIHCARDASALRLNKSII